MAKQSKYTKEFLEPIIKDSYSMREVYRKLGCKENNATNNLTPIVKKLKIDISHFKPYGVKRKGRWTDAEVFTKNSVLRANGYGKNGQNRGSLTTRLKRYKEYKCEFCDNIGMWLDKELTLEVDHINGDNTDNSLENLRFLCPNCHTQTETYKGKNRSKKESKTDE